jgi:hypothetical protein
MAEKSRYLRLEHSRKDDTTGWEQTNAINDFIVQLPFPINTV